MPGIARKARLAAAGFLAGLFVRGGYRQPSSIGDVRKVLVFEPGNIGDVVLLTPFLRALRERFPNASTTLVSKPVARVVLAHTELAADFIELDFDLWTRDPFKYEWRRAKRLVHAAREREADAAFTCRHHIRERVIVAMSRARRTVGYALGGAADRLLTDPVPVGDPDQHKTDDWLGLLRPFGVDPRATPPVVRVSDAERARAAAFVGRLGITASDVVVAIHPGASVADKRWPLERFAAVAAGLSNRSGVRVLWFIDPDGYGSDLGLPDAVSRVREDLRGMISLFAMSDLFVGNDSGPMHLAAAVGVPTVAVFKRDAVRWFAPHGDHHTALMATGAERDDLVAIPVADVLQAVDAALARVSPRA